MRIIGFIMLYILIGFVVNRKDGDVKPSQLLQPTVVPDGGTLPAPANDASKPRGPDGTALFALTPGRRIPGFDGLCALCNMSIAEGCTLISTGKPVHGYESLPWRARHMRGEWADLAEGNKKEEEGEVGACSTPLNCAMGNNTFLAVDIGVPGHGYCDIVRAAPYARASTDPSCPKVSITQVVRTQNKRGHNWQAFFLQQAFPGARVRMDGRYILADPGPPHYPKAPMHGACCATCVEPPDRSTGPFVGFSQSTWDRFRCTMWAKLGLPTARAQPSSDPLLQVLVVLRKGKRSWGNSQALTALIEQSAALSKTWSEDTGETRVVVKGVFLESLKPEEQCRILFSSHLIVAIHGSSFGNLFCAAPGSVVIEVFPPHFHLDMFGLLAAASGVFNLNLLPDPYPNSTATPMSRGFKLHMYPPDFNGKARDVMSYQPSGSGMERALAAAALLLREEATAQWPALKSALGAC